jgi:hypothetical protein
VVLVGEDISELKEISDIVMAESQALVGVKGVVWASRDGAKQLIELIEEVVVVFVIIVQLGEVDISILVNGLAQG